MSYPPRKYFASRSPRASRNPHHYQNGDACVTADVTGSAASVPGKLRIGSVANVTGSSGSVAPRTLQGTLQERNRNITGTLQGREGKHMARKLGRLTTLQVLRLGVGRYPDAGNLYLHVTDDGRYWFFRWGVGRRPRYMSLGTVHSQTLKQARDRAEELRAQRLAGHDPKVERERAAAAAKIAAGHSFANVMELYLASHEAQWEKRTAHELRGMLELQALPLLGDLAISAIDTPAILQILPTDLAYADDHRQPSPVVSRSHSRLCEGGRLPQRRQHHQSVKGHRVRCQYPDFTSAFGG